MLQFCVVLVRGCHLIFLQFQKPSHLLQQRLYMKDARVPNSDAASTTRLKPPDQTGRDARVIFLSLAAAMMEFLQVLLASKLSGCTVTLSSMITYFNIYYS